MCNNNCYCETDMKNLDLYSDEIAKCRVCNEKLSKIIDFGSQPLGNGFLGKSEFKNEFFFPMKLGFSEKSKMIQLFHQPEPERMFHDEYAFFSSTSKYMSKHFEDFSEFVISSGYLEFKNPFVIELGCNDGILLKNFALAGIKHLGIEPSVNVAKEANKNGVSTINEFFSEELAKRILNQYGKVDAFMAANVMCHLPEISDVVRGIKILLKDKGVVIFEDPYLGDVIKKTSYDQIYDEHVFLFSAISVNYLFNLHGMELIDLYPQKTHGGSMRYVLSKKGAYKPSERVFETIKNEKILGLDNLEKFFEFSKKVEKSKHNLITLLQELKDTGKVIAGYAATSKSTTVLNYCGIGQNLIDYICDTTPIKQGKYSPGMHIPVVSHNHFINNPPDFALLLAWNHSEEILEKEKNFINRGGSWITHVPEVKII